MISVLVVDDEPQILENVRKILAKKGYYPDGATKALSTSESGMNQDGDEIHAQKA